MRTSHDRPKQRPFRVRSLGASGIFNGVGNNPPAREGTPLSTCRQAELGHACPVEAMQKAITEQSPVLGSRVPSDHCRPSRPRHFRTGAALFLSSLRYKRGKPKFFSWSVCMLSSPLASLSPTLARLAHAGHIAPLLRWPWLPAVGLFWTTARIVMVDVRHLVVLTIASCPARCSKSTTQTSTVAHIMPTLTRGKI